MAQSTDDPMKPARDDASTNPEARSEIWLTQEQECKVLRLCVEDQEAFAAALFSGMGMKRRQEIAEHLLAIPPEQPRVLAATGRYLGEGFDDSRLDTLFLALPISLRGTLAQYV